MHTILQGFLVSGGLIVAIGAQNAFVLKQGLRRWHVLPIILTCFLCDCLLISVGVFGLGAFISQSRTASVALARLLIPLFRRPVTWRLLDGVIALIMWGIAYGLLRYGISMM